MKYAAALLLCLMPLLANALEQGDKLAPWTLLDQYDQAYSLAAGTHILLVARDMDGAKLVKAALAEQPKGYLEARDAVFVADIQRMPALISKLFAIPAMRDYNYRVLLDRDGRTTKAWGARILPATFVLGADGEERFRHFGALDWSGAEARRRIEALFP